MMSENICSILSASLCSYGIGEPGGVRGNRFAPGVGFTDAPIAPFTAGPDQIDACYVADTPDNVILAFRGTSIGQDGNERQVIIDLLNDFLAKPVVVNGIGTLHQGFAGSVERLWKKGFQNEVQKRMTNGNPLIITGYSKGAALAPIAAAFLHKKLSIEADRMIIRIFEPPRPGDGAFAKYFNKTFRTALRYEYQDDIVPHVPPVKAVAELLSKIPFIGEILAKYQDIDEWDYTSVGKLQFVNWDDEIVDDSPRLARERFEHLGVLVAEGKILKMGAEHMPCGHIYNVLCRKDCPN